MAQRVSSPTFVGRRHELDRATAALARAREGHPAVLLVGGEAGVGKTRFVQEVAIHARHSGVRVLEGGCVQLGEDGLPFGAIIEALRGLTRTLSPAEMDGLVRSGRTELARLMPDLAGEGERTPVSGEFDSSTQGRLFEHLLRLLERLADRAPVLVVIEDMHWADRSTLELLDFLVRNLRDGAITILATYRSDELHRRHPLLPVLAELERLSRTERLRLERFDRSELADQMEGILGQRPEPELVEQIAVRSAGNAFYAEELLAGGASTGHLPSTLREVLLARVTAVSEPTQELMRIASAGGARISPALLAMATGMHAQALTAGLREAVARQILVPQEGGPEDRYAFRHALVQEAVYGDLLPGERAGLHAAFARALADQTQPEGDASRAAELAYHWQAAHDLPRAFDAWMAAGLAAESIYAFAEAEAHYGRALELWDQVPDAVGRARVDRIELLMRAAADAEGTAITRSIAYIRSAIALADSEAEPARAGLLYERLGEYASHTLNDAAALLAYREAVRLVPAEPPSAARAVVLAGLGRHLFYARLHAESAAICEEAIWVARAVGAREVESRALIHLSGAQATLGDVETGMASLRRARDLALDLGDVHLIGLSLTVTVGGLIMVGRYEEAAAAGFTADAFAREHGLAARFGVVDLAYGAEALILVGRWNEAAEALAQAQRYYPSLAELAVEEVLLLLEACRGQFDLARRRATRLRTVPTFPMGSRRAPGLAELALWAGDPLAARMAIREGIALLDPHPEVLVLELGWTCALGIRAEADLASLARSRRSQSELHEAREIGAALLARMRSQAAEVASRRPYFAPEAEAWLATCEAEFSRLEESSAPDLWAAAATAWVAFGVPYYQAYALMREGEAALAGQRDRPRAASALVVARAIAVRLGAEPLRRAVDALAARAGVAPEPDTARVGQQVAPGTDVHRGRDDLSPREREVLKLLAAGRSNSEIGDALFISKKTASVHVASIKAKLGVGSRVEIVTYAIGLALVAGPAAEAEAT